MRVYTVRSEGVTVYSTARKAIESIDYGQVASKEIDCQIGDMDSINKSYNYSQAHLVDMEHKTEKDVKALITLLNKKGWLTIESGMDTVDIQVCEVR